MKNRRLYIGLAALAAAIAALAICCLSSGPSRAAKTESLPTLVVGCDTYPPFVSDDQDGNPSGIDVDILTEALGRIGYAPRFEYIDWEQKADLLAQGKIDMVASSFSMTGREDDYRWAGPYMRSRQVVAVDPASDIYSLADLEGKVIAVQSTTKPESIILDRLNQNVPEVKNVFSFAERSYINPALIKGYVDAIAAHETSLDTYMRDYGVSYRILDEPLLEVGLGAAFDKNDTRGIDVELSRAFEEMRADGTMEEILSRYFDDPGAYLDLEGLDD